MFGLNYPFHQYSHHVLFPKDTKDSEKLWRRLKMSALNFDQKILKNPQHLERKKCSEKMENILVMTKKNPHLNLLRIFGENTAQNSEKY